MATEDTSALKPFRNVDWAVVAKHVADLAAVFTS